LIINIFSEKPVFPIGLESYSLTLPFKPFFTIFFVKYNPNPLFDTPNIIKEKLEQASKEKSLPIVIKAKTQTDLKKWPTKRLNIPKIGKYGKMNLVINNFFKKNKYKKVWENDDFEILIPTP